MANRTRHIQNKQPPKQHRNKFIQGTPTQLHARTRTHTQHNRGHTRTDNKHKARVMIGVTPWNGQYETLLGG